MSQDKRIPNDDLWELARKQERPFLSILLRDKACLMDASAFGITQDHFWIDQCRFLYGVIMKNYKAHGTLLTRRAMSEIMDMSEMPGLNNEKKVHYKKLWDEIYNDEFSLEDYELLKKAINDRYLQHQAYKILQDFSDPIVNSTCNQSDVVKSMRDKVMGIQNLDPNTYCCTMSMADAMPRTMDYINNKRDNPEQTRGIMTGIYGVDEIFHGWEPTDYVVISGFINGGKTTFMFNLAMNMAKLGYSVAYVTMEKEAVPLNTRLFCLYAGIDYNRIKRGGKDMRGISDDLYEREILPSLKLMIDNVAPHLDYIQVPPKTKLTKILSMVDELKIRKKIDVLFVDYLQAIDIESNHSTRPDLDLHDVSQRLMAYGKTHRILTITALQLKNESVKELRKKGKKAASDNDSLSDLAINTEDTSGSRQILADADIGIGLVKQPPKIYLSVMKARDADQGKVIPLDFDGRLGRISDPEYSPNQIKEVDNLIYNTSVSVNGLRQDIMADDDGGIFSSSSLNILDEKPTEVKIVEPPKQEKAIEVKSVEKPKESIKVEKSVVSESKNSDDEEWDMWGDKSS